LAKQYHPDKNTGSHELFQEIQHAYNILGDEANKAKYDRKRMIIDP
jgi:curved DNA-binding protein CbpA